MLSYQHIYHAGNHADVLKHWLLVECMAYLQQKEKPFDYIDTHAGAGLYRVNSAMARKTGEADGGIRKLLAAPIAGMERYLEPVTPQVKGGMYPGSPALVNALLREGDKSWLYELHPGAFAELKKHCERRHTHVRQEDGWKGLLAQLPTPSRRALVLIDPSYEVKTEYRQVVDILEAAWRKMTQTLLLAWYPVVERARIDALEKALKKSALRNVLLCELGVRDDAVDAGMTASGMIIVNPPWTLAAQARSVLPALSELLSEDGRARWRCEQLIAE